MDRISTQPLCCPIQEQELLHAQPLACARLRAFFAEPCAGLRVEIMDPRPDTASSSGRFRGQWSFLANTPHPAQPRSLTPSSYNPLSDRSSVSLQQHNGTNASRSSVPKNLNAASIGGRSNTTIPSQPVLIRVHSADASAHLNPSPRPRRPINMNKNSGLPALSEFSIQGILSAIQEDVESDINTIAEILGRSRLVLADQHDSHMPPQGEIRAVSNSLQAVEEASASSERLAGDDVFILREDASLIEGSQAGSAAYGLLERLQAIPRSPRIRNEMSFDRQPGSPSLPSSPAPPSRNFSPLATHYSTGMDDDSFVMSEPQRMSRQLLRTGSEPTTALRTNAVVSETRTFAGANGAIAEDPTFLEQEIFDGTTDFHTEPSRRDSLTNSNAENDQHTIRERVQNLLYVSDPTGLTSWLQGQNRRPSMSNKNAEGHLRGLLGR